METSLKRVMEIHIARKCIKNQLTIHVFHIKYKYKFIYINYLLENKSVIMIVHNITKEGRFKDVCLIIVNPETKKLCKANFNKN